MSFQSRAGLGESLTCAPPILLTCRATMESEGLQKALVQSPWQEQKPFYSILQSPYSGERVPHLTRPPVPPSHSRAAPAGAKVSIAPSAETCSPGLALEALSSQLSPSSTQQPNRHLGTSEVKERRIWSQRWSWLRS